MSETVKMNQCPKCGSPISAEAPEGLCPKCVLGGAATISDSGFGASVPDDPPSLELVGVAFPQLEILELIGQGGMGVVYKARQPHLDRFVALKLLPEKLARDARFAERFNREGRVLAKLNHPNIVAVYDFGRAQNFFYLLMEYVDGVNLRQAMQAGRFSPGEALAIVPKICEALQYAHGQGILHRDIKPANILLDSHGQVKIADFGIAKLVGEEKSDVTLTATGAALGTPHYMAPEQLERPSEVDHRADIYSLGVVFYEMLTGELPIGRFAPPSSRTPVGTQVDEVVFRTLEKDRDRRYQSAAEMKTQVEHLGAGKADVASLQAAEDRRFSHWSIYGALGVGLSLPVPLFMAAAILAGRGRVGPGELWLSLGSVAFPGLGGTLLGWLGLNEIRDGKGRVRGLPLALFAALTWPLLVLGSALVGLPAILLVPDGRLSIINVLGRVLVLLIPAGVVTFTVWSIYATAQWAQGRTLHARRGVLKWIFLGLLAVGIGVVMATHSNVRSTDRRPPVVMGASQPSEELVVAAPNGMTEIRANLRIARGQVAVLQVLRRDDEVITPVPSFTAYAVAPDEERGRFSVVLTPTEPLPHQTNHPAWRLSLVSDDGATASGQVEDFGELFANLSDNHLLTIEPGTSSEIMLTRPYPAADTNGIAPRAQLSLFIASVPRGLIGEAREATTVSVGSTNWIAGLQHAQATQRGRKPRPGEVLAHQWLKAPVDNASTNSIQFTFTNVEIRQDASGKWLAIDYASDIRGDCEETFRVDGPANTQSRKSGLLVTPKDSPPVLRQRFELQFPAGVSQRAIAALSEEFGKALTGKSFVIPEGEQRPLLRFPVENQGFVTLAIGARQRLPEP